MTLQDWIEDDPVINDLSPDTIVGVAERLRVSTSFPELIYRECELDALWTLVDIEMVIASLNKDSTRALDPPLAPLSGLERLRELIFEAHELTSRRHPNEAADRLLEAVRVTAQWS